jgi:hypothetical protein
VGYDSTDYNLAGARLVLGKYRQAGLTGRFVDPRYIRPDGLSAAAFARLCGWNRKSWFPSLDFHDLGRPRCCRAMPSCVRATGESATRQRTTLFELEGHR